MENSIQSSRAVFSGLQTQQGYNTVILVLEPYFIVSLSAFPLFWKGEGEKKSDIYHLGFAGSRLFGGLSIGATASSSGGCSSYRGLCEH